MVKTLTINYFILRLITGTILLYINTYVIAVPKEVWGALLAGAAVTVNGTLFPRDNKFYTVVAVGILLPKLKPVLDVAAVVLPKLNNYVAWVAFSKLKEIDVNIEVETRLKPVPVVVVEGVVKFVLVLPNAKCISGFLIYF